MRKQARLAAITFRCSTDKAAIERRGEDAEHARPAGEDFYGKSVSGASRLLLGLRSVKPS